MDGEQFADLFQTLEAMWDGVLKTTEEPPANSTPRE